MKTALTIIVLLIPSVALSQARTVPTRPSPQDLLKKRYPDKTTVQHIDHSTGTQYSMTIKGLRSYRGHSNVWSLIMSTKRSGYAQASRLNTIYANVKSKKRNSLVPWYKEFPQAAFNHTVTMNYHQERIAKYLYHNKRHPTTEFSSIVMWRLCQMSINENAVKSLTVGNRVLWIQAGIIHMPRYTVTTRLTFSRTGYVPASRSYSNKSTSTQFYVKYQLRAH